MERLYQILMEAQQDAARKRRLSSPVYTDAEYMSDQTAAQQREEAMGVGPDQWVFGRPVQERQAYTDTPTNRVRGLLSPDVIERGALLPIGRTRDGGLTITPSEVMIEAGAAAISPGHAAEGRTYDVGDAANTAFLAGGFSYPLGGGSRDAVSMFIGPKAKNYPKEARELAIGEESKRTPVGVYKKTGMFKEPGGEWLSEISDDASRLRSSNEVRDYIDAQKLEANRIRAEADRLSTGSRTQPDLFPTRLKKDIADARKRAKALRDDANEYKTVGQKSPFGQPEKRGLLHHYLDHPELFENYPQLKGLPVGISNTRDFGMAGAYGSGVDFPEYGPMGKLLLDDSYYRKRDPRTPHSTLLHEVQHAIQEIEGLPRGGAVGSVWTKDEIAEFQLVREDVDRTLKIGVEAAMNRAKKGDPDAEAALRQFKDGKNISDQLAAIAPYAGYELVQETVNALNSVFPVTTKRAYDNYMKSAGENLAFATGERATLTPSQRRRQYPEGHMPKPVDKQIIQYQGDDYTPSQKPLAVEETAMGRGFRASTDEVLAGVGHNRPQTMYDLPSGSDPRYLGAAPDRNEFTYLRYNPRKDTPRVASAKLALSDHNNPVRKALEADIDRGMEIGESWYNTEELRDWFIAELGADEGHRQWAEYMRIFGATSPGSNVDANIGNSSAIRNRLYHDPEYRDRLMSVKDKAGGIALGKERVELYPGYGHKTQGLQELIMARQQRGEWMADPEPGVAPSKGSWTDQPKPKGFTASLMGSERNMASDLHNIRYLGMASRHPDWLAGNAELGAEDIKKVLSLGPRKLRQYIKTTIRGHGEEVTTFNAKKAVKDGKVTVDELADLGVTGVWSTKPNDAEYAAIEKLFFDIGRERGLTTGQLQAALWIGAAERTGVSKKSIGTFMDLMRRRLDDTAAKRGITRSELARDFIRNQATISGAPPGGLLGAANERREKQRGLMVGDQ